jgi:hypothetical protein
MMEQTGMYHSEYLVVMRCDCSSSRRKEGGLAGGWLDGGPGIGDVHLERPGLLPGPSNWPGWRSNREWRGLVIGCNKYADNALNPSHTQY